MKSTIFSLALCALCAGATAQTVTVADVEALPGETVAFVLNLTGGKANTYTAMQFDAHFPATGFATTGKYSVSELWENATATIGEVDASGVATIPVASSESISAADVEGLLSVSFTVGSDVAIDEYDVTLKNLWFGYGTSSKDYLDDVSFKVKVVAAHTVVLDENSTTAPEAAEGVNVRVLRTISAGQWSTICLPFAMTSEQTKTAFGDDVQLGDFTGCVATYDEAEENIIALKLNFDNVTVMEANHPYIIKVSQQMAEFTADGVDIDAEDEPSVDCDEYRTGSGTKKDPYVYHYNSFVGTYTAQTDVPELAIFISGNQFWYSTGLTKMKGYRAYFDFYDVLTSVEEETYSSRITMSFNGGETTGVKSIDDLRFADLRFDSSTVYDLQGRRVAKPGKGIYFVNGKKVIK